MLESVGGELGGVRRTYRGERGSHELAGGGMRRGGGLQGYDERRSARLEERLVVVAMFNCDRCGKRSFITRGTCFACGSNRPVRPQIVEEKWKAWALPKGVEAAVVGAPGEQGNGGNARVQTDRVLPPRESAVIPGTRNRWASPGGGARKLFGDDRRQGASEWQRDEGQGGGVASTAGRRINEPPLPEPEAGGAGSTQVSARHQPPQQGRKEERGQEQSGKIHGVAMPEEAKTQEVGVGTGQAADDRKGEWPVKPQPFAPPPLPRPLLASRAVQLEARIVDLQRNEGDPRIAVAQKSLEATRSMLREAGGPTERRLHFSALDADEKTRRAAEQVAKIKEEVDGCNKAVAAALLEQGRAEAKLAAAKQVHENAEARQVYLSFQIAVEAGRNVPGYDELVAALSQVEAHVLACGG